MNTEAGVIGMGRKNGRYAGMAARQEKMRDGKHTGVVPACRREKGSGFARVPSAPTPAAQGAVVESASAARRDGCVQVPR
jgi:hypothetical protein